MTRAVPIAEMTPTTSAVCAACPHPLDAHDPISLRFCTATTASNHTRGCVCPRSG